MPGCLKPGNLKSKFYLEHSNLDTQVKKWKSGLMTPACTKRQHTGEEEENCPFTEHHANKDCIENNRAKLLEEFAGASEFKRWIKDV